MYICEICGDVVDEIPTYTYYEKVDGNWAMSGYITEDKPCHCGGDYVKAVECKICGEYMPKYEGEVCESCKKEYPNWEEMIE